MASQKTSKVSQNIISEKLFKNRYETYNAVLKTETILWREDENIPISFISSSNPGFDFSNNVMKCLNKGTYKISLEGRIEANYETTLRYKGSGCPNNEYREIFLQKNINQGSHEINWSVILELDYGKEFIITTDKEVIYTGQLIIVKI